MRLPESFINEMTGLFDRFGRSGETRAFLSSFYEKPWHGLRANGLKTDAGELRHLLAVTWDMAPDQLSPVAWSDDGFYFPENLKPGRLALHAAGLYYIQEPSAMLPAGILDARPGERVMDLCAAPGGKACKIASDLKGRGILWANEISSERAKALLRNIEQTGCINCVVTRESTCGLSHSLEGFFDKVLVDAPCSGQGMFRRDPSAIGSFQLYGSSHYTGLQRGILKDAWRMLRPGGVLVYSTCTFSIAENEEAVGWMLSEHADCRVEPIIKQMGVSDGLPTMPDMAGTARIWPHLSKGEGHFCALLRKLPVKSAPAQQMPVMYDPGDPSGHENRDKACEAFSRFCKENLTPAGFDKIREILCAGRFRADKRSVYLTPPGMSIPGLPGKMKAGLYLGQVRPIRDGQLVFEPSQSFLLSLKAPDIRYQASGSAGSDLVIRYLRGETLTRQDGDEMPNGRFAAVMIEGLPDTGVLRRSWPLGWAKVQEGNMLKNLYPKAWRMNL